MSVKKQNASRNRWRAGTIGDLMPLCYGNTTYAFITIACFGSDSQLDFSRLDLKTDSWR